MVDVGDKQPTPRRAVARGRVRLGDEAFAAVRDDALAKGDVFAIARLAGIQGAKETARLVPLCHPVPLSHVEVDIELDEASLSVVVTASTRTEARTGVEMEALTAVATAALAIYDTCKAVSKGLVIEEIRLLRKEGGRSGTWIAPEG
jgi:cyclic pyranopterin phosphate synthase